MWSDGTGSGTGMGLYLISISPNCINIAGTAVCYAGVQDKPFLISIGSLFGINFMYNSHT